MAKAALSLPLSGVSGSLGDLTFVQRPDGPVVRERRYRPVVPTPGQAAGADRMRHVSRAWHLLDDATFEAWNAYAETRAWRNPATGAVVRPKAFNLFCGLASRARMVDPALDLSSFGPPGRVFAGDGVVIEVTPSSSGSSWRGGQGERSGSGALDHDEPPPPAPSSITNQMEEGVLVFSSSGANAPGVVTELLAQPLVNARRRVYMDKYASLGFVAFGPEEPEVEVALAPGWYAVAYRFLEAATGQAGPLVPWGKVRVTSDVAGAVREA